MITLLIMVLLTLLSIAALSTGVVLIIASLSEWFVSWLILNMNGSVISLFIGVGLVLLGYYIKKGQKWFLDFKIKNQISKALQEYLKKDIETTIELHHKRMKENNENFFRQKLKEKKEPEFDPKWNKSDSATDILLKAKKALDESDEFIKKNKEFLAKTDSFDALSKVIQEKVGCKAEDHPLNNPDNKPKNLGELLYEESERKIVEDIMKGEK